MKKTYKLAIHRKRYKIFSSLLKIKEIQNKPDKFYILHTEDSQDWNYLWLINLWEMETHKLLME